LFAQHDVAPALSDYGQAPSARMPPIRLAMFWPVALASRDSP